MKFHNGKTKMCWPPVEKNRIWFFPAIKNVTCKLEKYFCNFHSWILHLNHFLKVQYSVFFGSQCWIFSYSPSFRDASKIKNIGQFTDIRKFGKSTPFKQFDHWFWASSLIIMKIIQFVTDMLHWSCLYLSPCNSTQCTFGCCGGKSWDCACLQTSEILQAMRQS